MKESTAHSRLNPDNFETGDIDEAEFDHQAHVYLAWQYLQKDDVAVAVQRYDDALKRLVRQLGATEKYHATLTWFFLLLIAERHEANESWTEFKNRNRDLMTDSRNLLSRYYSDATLFSARARRRFVLPDNLAPVRTCC